MFLLGVAAGISLGVVLALMLNDQLDTRLEPPDRDRHLCEPTTMPTALGQTWTCPACGQEHEAFDVLADEHLPEIVKASTPAGTLGWRSVRWRLA